MGEEQEMKTPLVFPIPDSELLAKLRTFFSHTKTGVDKVLLS